MHTHSLSSVGLFIFYQPGDCAVLASQHCKLALIISKPYKPNSSPVVFKMH